VKISLFQFDTSFKLQSVVLITGKSTTKSRGSKTVIQSSINTSIVFGFPTTFHQAFNFEFSQINYSLPLVFELKRGV